MNKGIAGACVLICFLSFVFGGCVNKEPAPKLENQYVEIEITAKCFYVRSDLPSVDGDKLPYNGNDEQISFRIVPKGTFINFSCVVNFYNKDDEIIHTEKRENVNVPSGWGICAMSFNIDVSTWSECEYVAQDYIAYSYEVIILGGTAFIRKDILNPPPPDNGGNQSGIIRQGAL